jgi:hypothetical protein
MISANNHSFKLHKKEELTMAYGELCSKCGWQETEHEYFDPQFYPGFNPKDKLTRYSMSLDECTKWEKGKFRRFSSKNQNFIHESLKNGLEPVF